MANNPPWANVQHLKGVHAAAPCAGSPRTVRYEGYGPGASALLIDCLTEHPEGTRALLRRLFVEHGGYLGAEDSVSYLFDHVGLLRYLRGPSVDGLIQAAVAAGAEDVIGKPEMIEVITDPEEFEAICAELRRKGLPPLTAEVTERASHAVLLSGESARDLWFLIEALVQLQDVCDVYTNAELTGAPAT